MGNWMSVPNIRSAAAGESHADPGSRRNHPAEEKASLGKVGEGATALQHLARNEPMNDQASTREQHALILSMLPLVKTVVGRVAITLPAHVSQEDLLSAGVMGLMDAVRRFDPSKGASIKSYAAMRVRGSVLYELIKIDWVPRSVHRQAREFRKIQEALEQRLGREAKETELAQEMKISVEALVRFLESLQDPEPLVTAKNPRTSLQFFTDDSQT